MRGSLYGQPFPARPLKRAHGGEIRSKPANEACSAVRYVNEARGMHQIATERRGSFKDMPQWH